MTTVDAIPAISRWRPRAPALIARAFVLGPILVVASVFILAVRSAGWDLDGLTLVQTVMMVTLGAVVAVGAVRRAVVTGPLVAVVVGVALTAVWSVRPEASVRALMVWTMYLGIFVLTASTLSSSRAATRVLDAALGTGAGLCLLALSWSWGASLFATRWYATFYWPNPFAGFLLLLLPMAFIRLLHARTLRETLALGVITLTLAVALVLTYSRGAWLSLALIAPLALAMVSPPARGAAVRRATVLVAMVGLAVVLLTGRAAGRPPSPGILERAASAAETGSDSIQGRLSFWRSALAIFRDHPLVGTGPWTYGVVHTRYQDDVRFYASDAHNLYLQTAAEMGVVGLVALAVLMLAIASSWLRALRAARNTSEYPVVAGVGLGLVAFFLHSALDVNWAFPANPALAFAMVGVLAWYERSSQGAVGPQFRVPTRSWRVGAGVAMLGAVIVVQVSRGAAHQFMDGQRLTRGGQWSAAATRFAQARELNPLHPDYRLAHAVALMHLPSPSFDLAVLSVRRAIELDRMNATYPTQLAILLMGHSSDDPRQRAEAERLLQQALVLDRFNDPAVYRILAQLYLRQGRVEDAAGIYRTARALYLHNNLSRGGVIYQGLWEKVVDLFMESAELFVRRGAPAEATRVLGELLAEDPGAVRVAVRCAALYREMGRLDEARTVLEAASAKAPDSAEIHAALKTLR